MEILVVGVNHKTAPVEIRERFAVPSHKTESAFQALSNKGVFKERLILSTCNRTEIYGVGESAQDSIQKTKEFLSEYSNLEIEKFEDKLYILKQPDSVKHLFTVASGLDSMVLGETEIIGQVKDAYLSAHKNQQTGKVLNTLFQKSFKVAKDLRSQTQIGVGQVSIASVAVNLAEKIFEDLANTRVMVIGTGQMATQVAKTMLTKGARSLFVSSHHHDRAQALALSLGGEAIEYQSFENRVQDVNVVIASTLAPKVLIHKEQVKTWMKARHERPLFIIDIAVPRNIDPEIEKLDNVYLYNIDDLREIADKNMAYRQSQIDSCSKLIESQKENFMHWLFKEFR